MDTLESILDADLAALRNADPAKRLEEELLGQLHSLEVSEKDLEGKNIGSPFFLMMYLLAA